MSGYVHAMPVIAPVVVEKIHRHGCNAAHSGVATVTAFVLQKFSIGVANATTMRMLHLWNCKRAIASCDVQLNLTDTHTIRIEKYYICVGTRIVHNK